MVNNTQYLTSGKSPNPLSPPTNLAAKAGNAQVTLTWNDPPNATSEPSGQTIATWAYTQIVRKEGSQPTGPGDGTVVVQSSVRDQYSTSGFVDTGLTNDTLYYYGAFAYNSDKVVSEGAFVSATPQAGTPLSELTEGTLITINESGAPVEFYISKQNYEPGLNGAGRVLCVRKDVQSNQVWDAGNVNAYATSDIDAWFNGTYKNTLSSNVQTMIATTKFYYTPGNGNNTVSTLERSIFSLSLTELGESHSYANVEGSALPIASTLKIAYLNGNANTQWTRSPYTNYSNDAWGLFSNGNVDHGICGNTFGYRPCFTLPSTALVDSNNALIETA